jgi:hypothetical protein
MNSKSGVVRWALVHLTQSSPEPEKSKHNAAFCITPYRNASILACG